MKVAPWILPILTILCGFPRAMAFPDRLSKSISLSHAPLGVAIHPQERFLYLLSSENNSLMTLDTFFSKQVSQATISGVPRSLTINNDATRLYVATDQSDRILSYDISAPSTPVFKETLAVANATVQFDQLLFSPAEDGRLFLLSQTADKIFVFTLSTVAMATIDPGMEIVSIALAETNRLVVLGAQGVANVYSTASLNKIGNSVDFGALSTTSGFSHVSTTKSGTGSYAFIPRAVTPGELWLLNLIQPTNFFSFGSVVVGANPTSSVSMNVLRPQGSSGSKYLFVANSGDQTLSVIDVAAIGGTSVAPLVTIASIPNVTKEGLVAAPTEGYVYAVNSLQKAVSVISDQPLIQIFEPPETITSESNVTANVSSSRAGELSVVLYQGTDTEAINVAKGVSLTSASLDTNVGKAISFSTEKLEEGNNTIGFFLKSGDYASHLAINLLRDTVPSAPGDFRLQFGNEKIFVRWKRSPEKDISHYLIYFGTTDAEGGVDGIASPIQVSQGTGSNMSFVLTPVSNGTKVYVKVIAVDQTGNKSEPTATLSETTEQTFSLLDLTGEKGGCATSDASLFFIVFLVLLYVRRPSRKKNIGVLLLLFSFGSIGSIEAASTYSLGFGVGWWVPRDASFKQFIGKQGNEMFLVKTGLDLNHVGFHFDVGLLSEESALLGVQTGRQSGETQDLFVLAFQPSVELVLTKSFFLSPFVRVGHDFHYFSLQDPTEKVRGLKQLSFLSGGLRILFDSFLDSNDPQDMLGIQRMYLELSAVYSKQWTGGLDFGGWTFAPSLGIDF